MQPPHSKSILLNEFWREEVKNLIKSFNVNKSTGPCSVPPKIINMVCDNIAYPIAKIANTSFATGVHQERLKIAKVIPIFKIGSKMLTSNYRPISLLSNLNKILEKLMFTGVHSSLENENLIFNKNLV